MPGVGELAEATFNVIVGFGGIVGGAQAVKVSADLAKRFVLGRSQGRCACVRRGYCGLPRGSRANF